MANLNIVDKARRTSISKLSPDYPNCWLIGIIIAKQEPRSVASRSDNGMRFVMGFTFRDSPTSSLNVTCWGNQDYIQDMADRLEIGDMVEIKNANVQFRNDEQSGGKFRPTVSSPFQLTVSDMRGEIVPHVDPSGELLRLMHSPPKPFSSCCRLEDIVFSGEAMNGETVNILVAVRSIGSLQTINSKDGRALTKQELRVFDQTYPHFLVTLWGSQYTPFVRKWITERTVLFLSDVRLQFNTYHKSMVASVGSSTTITVEPALPEGRSLRQYAGSTRLALEDTFDDHPLDDTELASLPIYTVETLQNAIREAVEKKNSETDFRGVIYCFISNFDLDGYTGITILRCGQCKQQLRPPLKHCTNNECNMPPEERLYLRIWLSDHTGTIQNCLLNDQPFQKILGCTAVQFNRKSEEEKTEIKWKFLLERCKVLFNAQGFFSPTNLKNHRKESPSSHPPIRRGSLAFPHHCHPPAGT